MLIYVQLFGGVVQQTLPVDIKAECTIGDLQKRILTLHPGVTIKRCIFAGKQLDDQNKTIGQNQAHWRMHQGSSVGTSWTRRSPALTGLRVTCGSALAHSLTRLLPV